MGSGVEHTCRNQAIPPACAMLPFDDAVLQSRRSRIQKDITPALGDSILLVYAGNPIPLPENTDQTYPFRSHAEYFFLTTLECPGGVVAFDPNPKSVPQWRSFVPALTENERIWEGRTQAPGEPLDALTVWLKQQPRSVVRLGSPPPTMDISDRDDRTKRVREQFRHARRPKDALELELLRRAAACTAGGFEIMRTRLGPAFRPASERSLQIELETGFFEAGARRTGYGSIVGSGPNAAVLHFDPSDRRVNKGEFVLIDAGAEIDRYVCDVTRTYVAGGKPTPFQRDLHALVLSVEEAAINRCRSGAEWKEIHFQAAIEISAGLVDLGLFRGSPESLVERSAHTLFFPHGLGHLVGLGVRDASGTLPGRPKDARAALQTLRTDLPLMPGYVITVEPGVYFIPTLLNDPVRRERFRDCVAWDRVEPLLSIGGVRIEDNVLITKGAPEVLTAAIPKVL